MNRILVIRGGAIGDFILTLPALKALRDARPQAHMEIFGYKHIAVLAEKRFYAQAVHSIEYGPLARFFARNSELPAELADYFASFDLIVSYLYDPDQIFETNLCRCGVQNLICGPARIVENAGHAARQLARPIEELGINVVDFAERIFPSMEDREFAREFLASVPQPIVAIHPGSGSHEKNWPLENWIGLFSSSSRLADIEGLVVISGEADEAQTDQLEREWKNRDIRSPGTCRCLVSQPCLSVRYSSGMTAEFRIWLRPSAQIVFSFSVLLIQMFGRQRTRTFEFSGRRAGNSAI
jgi:heptosyltransferase III